MSLGDTDGSENISVCASAVPMRKASKKLYLNDICLELLKMPVHILIQSLKCMCGTQCSHRSPTKFDSAESSVLALKSLNKTIFSSLGNT